MATFKQLATKDWRKVQELPACKVVAEILDDKVLAVNLLSVETGKLVVRFGIANYGYFGIMVPCPETKTVWKLTGTVGSLKIDESFTTKKAAEEKRSSLVSEFPAQAQVNIDEVQEEVTSE